MSKKHTSWSFWNTLLIEIEKRLTARQNASPEERQAIISQVYAEHGVTSEKWEEYWDHLKKTEKARGKSKRSFYDRPYLKYTQLRSASYKPTMSAPNTPFLKREFCKDTHEVLPPPATKVAKGPRSHQPDLFDMETEARSTRHYPKVSAVIEQMRHDQKSFGRTESVALDKVIHAHRVCGEIKNVNIGGVATKIKKDARIEALKKKRRERRSKHSKKTKIRGFGEAEARLAKEQRQKREKENKQ